MSLTFVIAGCATAQLTQSGDLESYANLKPSDGVLTKTRQSVDRQTVLAARTVYIEPTRVSPSAAMSGLTSEQLKLVTNALDRGLCFGLGKRFEVVGPGQPAELKVAAVITKLQATDVIASTASKVVDVGGTVVRVTTGIPVPAPRLPFGLGSLSVESVALTPDGRQAAAMTWARGADVMTIRARMSEDGDAYALAKEFATDFSKLLVTGTDPMQAGIPELPTLQGVSEFFGGKPKHSICEQFGRNPGLENTIGHAIGLPPNWTDGGANNSL